MIAFRKTSNLVKNHFLCKKKLQKLLIYIGILILCTQCAQITPLTGGKKDTEAPKIIKSEPENASLNFNANEITIHFDEYISIKDLSNQLIITPQTKELPEVEAQGKKLKIKFNEPLMPNTTYKLAFGNAIVDLRELNILQNFEYIFSTGTTIDSLNVSGSVINCIDKKPMPQVMVGLYPNDATDSVIYKNKPLYITKTNSNGFFRFSYLPDVKFKLIAINDQNKNILYDGSEEQIAFNNHIISSHDTLKHELTLFKETPARSFLKKSIALEYGKAALIYNKAQEISLINAQGLIHYYQSKTLDTTFLYYNNVFDTLTVKVNYDNRTEENLIIKIPSKNQLEKQNTSNTLKYVLESNVKANLPYFENPSFKLNFPIEKRNINSNKISLLEIRDSLKIKKEFEINCASENLVTEFSIHSDFKPESSYQLLFLKGALDNSLGRMNDSVNYNFKTDTEDDYAQLTLNILFPNKENFILQLLNDKNQVVREEQISFSVTSTSEKTIQYKNLNPGNYTFKVIEDANKNGRFDTGNYFSHQQPETIFIQNQSIKLLAGWEIETKWNVN